MKSENTFSLEVGNHKLSCLHFTGIMGSGMSALAQYLAWSGATVTGSDRIAFEEELKETRGKLERCGCAFFPQDGTGVHDRTDAVVVSTAIEEDNPDIAAARTRNMPVLHRSDILAAIVAGHRTIAVCGTSGKSTVTALVFEILHACGRDPSLLTGANLTRLEGEGLLGNAYKGTSGALVIEADESDGTLTKYRAETAVFLNISKDHQPVEKTLDLFREVADRTPVVFKNADDPGLAAVRADQIFGLSGAADWKPQTVHSLTPRVRFTVGKVDFELPAPGAHNLSNCLAAVAVCAADGLTLEQIAGAMREFKGISRRFSVSRTARGIVVIDDYAHNPEKIKAALLTARDFGRRVLAVFQPHGFGPTRFLKDELIAVFSDLTRQNDEVYLLPIYYAGGTVKKDISSDILADAVRKNGAKAFAPQSRRELLSLLQARVKPEDVVLLMGARDPTLSVLAKEMERDL